MPDDPNVLRAIKPRLSAQTLRDIEGLDPEQVGFGRSECCGPVPAGLRDSMKLHEHLFYVTPMPATAWLPKLENVPGWAELEPRLKEATPDAKRNVCYEKDTEGYVLRFVYKESQNILTITQYSNLSPGEVPWLAKGTLQADCTDQTFVFVCSHSARDKRCGYCGAVLVDLIRREVCETLGEGGEKQVMVYPCSHVGGHIYAGNVLTYSRRGGVCFGLFKPEDVHDFVKFITTDNSIIPQGLRDRVRGSVGNLVGSSSSILPI